MVKIWVGVDIGKEHHHIAVIDVGGRLVYSHRVVNDERALLAAMAEVSATGRAVCWAVNVTTDIANEFAVASEELPSPPSASAPPPARISTIWSVVMSRCVQCQRRRTAVGEDLNSTQ
ncbi:transposase [Actinoplanes sp. NPDC051851]|uniref:IS110 family transposase n=1 Tax=Actinoplanes sp. NPDC051851 TaxID=3154753 RepID=UPI0034146DAA